MGQTILTIPEPARAIGPNKSLRDANYEGYNSIIDTGNEHATRGNSTGEKAGE